jgi:4-amino-4-deoxy-L-arabinose transferase-like glycosyltransferase
MRQKSQSGNLNKSWMSKHPLVVIGVVLAVCLVPFINKAVHWDDPLYVWSAEWIQKHPANFYGFGVNLLGSTIPMWVANWNPPLLSYFLAGVASLFGWHEFVLHLACMAVAFTATAGIYALAQMWCKRPLLATLVAIFTPAFLVSSTTLMCDVPMLAFWIWALVLWERALTGSAQSPWRFVVAGLLAGLAVLTKYSAVTLLPLLPILAVLRTRRIGWWWVGLAVPLLMVAGYEWLTAEMFGRGLFSLAVGHTQHSRLFPTEWEPRGITGLAFAGGCLLPLLFFAPLVWRWQVLLAGGVVVLGVLMATIRFSSNLGLFMQTDGDTLLKHWEFLLQLVFLCAGGVHLLLLTGAEVWQRRNINSIVLAIWISIGVFSAIVLNFAVNARSLLLVVPAAAIFLVRRLDAVRGNPAKDAWLLWPLIPAAVIALSLVWADYQQANSARTAARLSMTKYSIANHTTWFEGHSGYQYYMEKFGAQPLDVERTLLQPGDIVIVPALGVLTPLPPGSVGWLNDFHYDPASWMTLMGGTESGAAGFYGANWGPVPFFIGKPPPQSYFVVEVFSRVQFHSQPINPQEVRAGGVPVFTHHSPSAYDTTDFPLNPEAMKQLQMASRLETEGAIEEAIQHYRLAMAVDPDNPVVLNDLARILATAGEPGLRNGQEAVQLGTKAAELTDYRQPNFIETLAAACAQDGQFSKAVWAANVARDVAYVTGLRTLAAKDSEMMILYSSGQTIGAGLPR